ncbi:MULTISPECIES: ribonuclease HIII [Pontibacillus]|uniref:Ribonuclease HIII n=1 Tax=Pontibacillus chungwhensis TaxID=265426 RepID=A0ABY8UUL3_9BACI|nr:MULTISPECIES: ribonuclease HIII [Pontibacillus]MCD5323796.1 ribonuclease HIII [Pontibacillus sp. HN14]WIF97159.1 ribonuclease HIII [Pontibacillus chungwhensis]
MSQTVLKLPTNQLYKMQSYYQKTLKGNPPPGAVFAAKVNGCSITAYKSGKVLFQGPNHEQEAGKWGTASPSQKKPSKSSPTESQFAPPSSLYTSSHAGSDEAGTGDYFGPITVACAYVREDQIAQLKAAGVRDSKSLKDPQIEQIARKIVKMNIPYSLVTLHNDKYNQWQRKGWSQGKMKTMLHHHAYNKLLQKMNPDQPEGWVIDQFAERSVYEKHLRTEKATLQDNVYFLKKAESYSIAVAAASIIARTAFVHQMDKLSERAGMPLPKGASKRVDQAAAKLIETKGADVLEQFAKVHFANTEKAYKWIK